MEGAERRKSPADSEKIWRKKQLLLYTCMCGYPPLSLCAISVMRVVPKPTCHLHSETQPALKPKPKP